MTDLSWRRVLFVVTKIGLLTFPTLVYATVTLLGVQHILRHC